MEVSAWDRMMNVNVRAMVLTMKHGVPLMAENGGAVVNMASVSAFVGSDGYAAYVTTKGAVISLTRSAAVELAPPYFCDVMSILNSKIYMTIPPLSQKDELL